MLSDYKMISLMLKKLFCYSIACSSFLLTAHAQKIAEFKLVMKGSSEGINVPASLNLDEITPLSATEINLVEVKNNQRIAVPFQIDNNRSRILYWLVEQKDPSETERVYELVKETPPKAPSSVNVSNDNGALIISTNGNNLLQYVYKTHYPPSGVDTAFKRSGFIHPLWTPHGQELTRINPSDHYHHFGIWNPWTKVLFEGETVDFWNIKDGTGTVRFANLVSINEGAIYGDYQTLHQHVVFKKNGDEKVAINELQSVRIYQPRDEQDYYIADITIQLNCASDSPVLLQEYRYGGLGWRATEKWHKGNSETITSEGKSRADADGSTARWVILQGELDEDYGGVVMMSYPTNYNHPEPLRIWPESMHGRGDVFANFSPTKDKDWPLEPGKNYVLKYRLVVFNGKFTKEKAEAAWQHFAHSPKIDIQVYQ